MTWIDGITCSVLLDGDAVAEVVRTMELDDADTQDAACLGVCAFLWNFEVECPNGCAVGTHSTMDAAKLAAERAIRTMRGEGEG